MDIGATIDLATQPLIEQIESQQKEIEQFKEENRILKQYAEISRNDKHQRKARLNEALEEIKQLKK